MRQMCTMRTEETPQNTSIKRSIYGRESASKRKRCNNIPYSSRSRRNSDTIQLVFEDIASHMDSSNDKNSSREQAPCSITQRCEPFSLANRRSSVNFLIELDDLALGLIGSMSLANEAMNILSRTATSSEEFAIAAVAADAASVAADVSAGGGLGDAASTSGKGPAPHTTSTSGGCCAPRSQHAKPSQRDTMSTKAAFDLVAASANQYTPKRHQMWRSPSW